MIFEIAYSSHTNHLNMCLVIPIIDSASKI